VNVVQNEITQLVWFEEWFRSLDLVDIVGVLLWKRYCTVRKADGKSAAGGNVPGPVISIKRSLPIS
jgi:hypothetical protein